MINKVVYNKIENIAGVIIEEVKDNHRFADEIVMWYKIKIFGSNEIRLFNINNFWKDWKIIKI